MKKSGLLNLCILLPLLVLSACAGQVSRVTVAPGPGAKAVAIQASSFAFAPAHIVAHQGDRLLLKVTNAADTTHNLSVKDPQGDVVLNEDLPVGASVDISLDLTEAGTWKFFCNRPFHELLGMSGRIEVVPRP